MQIEQHAHEVMGYVADLQHDFDKFTEDFDLIGKHLGQAQAKFVSAPTSGSTSSRRSSSRRPRNTTSSRARATPCSSYPGADCRRGIRVADRQPRVRTPRPDRVRSTPLRSSVPTAATNRAQCATLLRTRARAAQLEAQVTRRCPRRARARAARAVARARRRRGRASGARRGRRRRRAAPCSCRRADTSRRPPARVRTTGTRTRAGRLPPGRAATRRARPTQPRASGPSRTRRGRCGRPPPASARGPPFSSASRACSRKGSASSSSSVGVA